MYQKKAPQRRGRSASLSSIGNATVDSSWVPARGFPAKNKFQRLLAIEAPPRLLAIEAPPRLLAIEAPPSVMALTAYSHADKQQYLDSFGNQSYEKLSKRHQEVFNKRQKGLANIVLNWVNDITQAREIMSLNPTLAEVEEMMKLNLPVQQLADKFKELYRPDQTVLAKVTTYSNTDLEAYLAKYNPQQQASARQVIDWVFDFKKAEQIMTINPTVADVRTFKRRGRSVDKVLECITRDQATNVAHLNLLLDSPVRSGQDMTNAWADLNHSGKFDELERNYPAIGTKLPGLFGFWASFSQEVRSLGESGRDPSRNELRRFLSKQAEFHRRARSLKSMSEVSKLSDKNLNTVQKETTRLTAANAAINQLLLYYPVGSTEHTAIIAQQALILNNQLTLTGVNNNLTGAANSYRTLNNIDLRSVKAYNVNQANYETQLAGTPQTVTAIETALATYINNAGYKDFETYTNLNLTLSATSHVFWGALNKDQKKILNDKLAGSIPTVWISRTYPGTRRNRPGNVSQILVPQFANGRLFSGEIIHDWLFAKDTAHGKSTAKEMHTYWNLASNPNPRDRDRVYYRGIGQNRQETDRIRYTGGPDRGKIVHSWDRISNRLVVDGNTLVTYFNDTV